MKAPSQDFTVLSRGLFLFSGAFALTGAQERFSHLGGRLPSHAAKVVLQLTYGGERGGFFERRSYSLSIFAPQPGQ
jgi:hypothetical protein